MVQLFPRGNTVPPMLFDSERSASGFWYFATRRVPKHYEKIPYVEGIPGWIEKVSFFFFSLQALKVTFLIF